MEVVLFDLDDTLMAHTRSVDLAISRAQAIAGQLAETEATLSEGATGAGAVGAHPDAAGLAAFAVADATKVRDRWRHLEEHHYTRYLTGELDYMGQRIWRARELLLPYGVELDDEAALRWFAEYLHGYRDNWSLFDDVLPALDAVEAALPGVHFGIITNGDLTFQTDKLHRIELWDRLDLTPVRADGTVDDPARDGRLIASGELGVTKPDAAIFEAAARAFRVSTASCVYVGDRLATDALGATAAGMRGVWLDRHDRNDTTAEAHLDLPGDVPRIRTLAELPALLTPQ